MTKFSFSEHFWGKPVPKCICKVHSDMYGFDVPVTTSWNREDEGQGNERYEVRARADHFLCEPYHFGATDDRIITKVQWDNANEDVRWEFFQNI